MNNEGFSRAVSDICSSVCATMLGLPSTAPPRGASAKSTSFLARASAASGNNSVSYPSALNLAERHIHLPVAHVSPFGARDSFSGAEIQGIRTPIVVRFEVSRRYEPWNEPEDERQSCYQDYEGLYHCIEDFVSSPRGDSGV